MPIKEHADLAEIAILAGRAMDEHRFGDVLALHEAAVSRGIAPAQVDQAFAEQGAQLELVPADWRFGCSMIQATKNHDFGRVCS